MCKNVKTELQGYIQDYIEDCADFGDYCDWSDLHQEIFNEDYYIIGELNAEEWIKNHNLNIFDMIELIKEQNTLFNPEDFIEKFCAENLVNLYVFYVAEDLVKEAFNEFYDNN